MPAATAQAAEAIGSAEAKPCARDGERSKKRTGPARCRTPGGQAVSAASDSSESSDARDQAACDVSSPGGPRPGTPRRERSRLKGQEGRRPGGFRPVEGRRLRKPWRGRNPGRQGSEVARACALRSSFPFPVGVILWSRGRNSSEGRGNGRRGEAPRGAPPAGRSKALKGAIPRALRWPRAAARRGGA